MARGEYENAFPANAGITNAGLAVLLVFGSATIPIPEEYAKNVQFSQSRSWEFNMTQAGNLSIQLNQDSGLVLGEFAKKLASNIVDPDPAIDRIITEHFWELI